MRFLGLGDSDVALNLVLNGKDQSGAAVDSAEGRFAKLKDGVSKLHLGLVALGAASGAAIGFLSDSARAANEDQVSVDRLRQAVENTGSSWDKTAPSIEAAIARGHDLSFTHDQVRSSLAVLVAETGNTEEALKRQKIAMDFARGAGIDLETASKLLGKATDSNIKVLGRYGIHVQTVAVSEAAHTLALQQVATATLAHDKASVQLHDTLVKLHGRTKLTADEQIKLREAHKAVDDATVKLSAAQEKATRTTQEGANTAALMAEVQKRYGSQAETYAKTNSGAIDRIKDSLHEWQVKLGSTLGPMQGFISLLPGISAGMALVGGAAGPLIGGFGKLFTGSLTLATGMGTLSISMLPITLTVLGIAAAVALLALAWSNNWGDIRGKTAAVISFVKPLLQDFFGFLSAVWQAVGPIVLAAAQTIIAPIQFIIDRARDAINILNALGIIHTKTAAAVPQLTGNGKATPNVHGIIGAAHGFEGVVARPTLFMAGEGGAAERVSIGPVGGGGATFHITINGNVDSQDRVRQLGIEFERQRRLLGGRTVQN